tara:strand:- start:1636 stop:1911 length:276 start_codon:yes stop_codon:yes gene_type:complete
MKELHYYDDNFKQTTGPTKDLYNTDNIVGDCGDIRGNAQNLTGDVSGICGNVTGLSGDATNCYSPGDSLYIGDVTVMRASSIAGTPTAEIL